MKPSIVFSPDILFDKFQENVFKDILQRMFPNHDQVVVTEEFTEGISGSWVFLVDPFQNDGILELPVVVKIAAASLIEKEWEAYHKYIKGKWPSIAEIKEKPVYDDKTGYAGLHYNHAGEGIFPVESLLKFFRDASLEDIQRIIQDHMAKIIERGLHYNIKQSCRYPLWASYDPVLPVNFLIKPISPTEHELPLLTPALLPHVKKRDDPDWLKQGDQLRVADFIVTKVDVRAKTVTLNLPLENGRRIDSFVVRLKYDSDTEIPAFVIGQPLPEAIDCEILHTRQDQWREEMKKILENQPFDFANAEVRLPTGKSLPNPFTRLSEMLFQLRDIIVNDIHGDLNLGNTLVDPQVCHVRLIDFAEARHDHVLHDFLRLETEVVTKLIPAALVEAELKPDVINAFYVQLHKATFGTDKPAAVRSPHESLDRAFTIIRLIRQIFLLHGLFKPNDYEEYYQCLTLYLLGALKFRNLDKESAFAPYPKQVAFLGAATLLSLLEDGSIDGDGKTEDKEKGFSLPEMFLIPAGDFLMGSDPNLDKNSRISEQPQHQLYLPKYYMSRTPITNAQYAIFINETGYAPPASWKNGQPPPEKEFYPVIHVSWYDAVAYCQWLTRKLGIIYRLPSEAEWEKAARGDKGRIYPWGNDWYAGRCNDHSNNLGGITHVYAFPEGESPYGLLDMVGNVWEWTASILKDYPLNLTEVKQDPEAPESIRRVIRGGSYFNQVGDNRCAARNVHLPMKTSHMIGFRVLRLAD